MYLTLPSPTIAYGVFMSKNRGSFSIFLVVGLLPTFTLFFPLYSHLLIVSIDSSSPY